ncbi:uncharacterized protein LOC125646393 [Ostrea edulis]|uniref:uncharacterized protein LOC125646393 n=1 Tax=Ostrea edulis TaxID=37623 RepID=UPI0024AFE7B4|nr:uncharacterized protein LOC125646393 [Ostrea edulis]
MVMAQREHLRKRIVEYLHQSQDKASSLKDITQNLGKDKKCINQVLYALKRQNALMQVSTVPPVWKLWDRGMALKVPLWPQNNKYSPRVASPKKRLKNHKETLQVDHQLLQKIREFLQAQNMPVKTMDIARHLGFRTSGQINPTLYNMERKGIVKKSCEGPVTWVLNSFGGSGEMALLDDPGIVGMGMLECNPQHANGGSQIASGGIVVQETNFAQPSPYTFDTRTVKCEGFDTSSEDPFMGNISISQLSEVGYESSQSEPSLSFDQINDAERILKNKGYIDEGSELTSIGECTENEIEMTTGNLGPVHQSTPLMSSPENDSSVQYAEGVSYEISGTQANSSDCEMSDSSSEKIDKVLKGLLKCPNYTGVSFIISKKIGSDMEKVEVEEILQKCVDFNYMTTMKSGSDTIYILTGAGEKYIKSKVGQVVTNNPQAVQQIRAPPRSMKTEFRGPPPVPANLVNNPNSEFCNPNISKLQNEQAVAQQASQGESLTRSTGNNPGPQPLMSINVAPVNVQCSGGLPSNSRFPNASLPLSLNSNQSNFNFQQRGPFATFGRGKGRGLMNFTTVNTSASPGGFTCPPTPVEMIRKQLTQTDISSKSESVTSVGISTSHVSLGLQKLRAQSASNPQQTTNHQPSAPSSFNFVPNVNTASGQLNVQNYGPRSLGVPQRPSPNPGAVMQQLHSLPLDLNTESFAALNKNPVSALMEYAQSRHQEAEIRVISQSGPSHKPRFVMGVFIGGKQIADVSCSNKKDGRKEVADKALRALIASGDYKASSNASGSKPQIPLDKMTHFDIMAALVHRSFNELSVNITENFSGRKVIAGLIMKMAPEDIGTVIAIGTGNRCITGPQLSLEGNTVNDSHAEIITRRGFIRFMYKQLMTYNPATSHRLFEQSPTGKLRLKDGIKFHLYISTAPCGDGALFSPRDEASNSASLGNLSDRTHAPTFSSAAQGLVRTKMEGGEGTIPVEEDFTVQTFDGIQRGERLRTMSCTDKLCRWNIVGMQGALLSHLLDPVYLDSLTLGLLYDHGHLSRAMCCRLSRGNTDINSQLPDPYHLNHPWLGRVTVCDVPRETQKTKALSVNWCYGDARPEVTDGTLGLCCTSIEKTLFSRCTKRNLYNSFKEVCSKFGKNSLLNFQTYGKTKLAAKEFQTAKKAILLKIKENNYGTWVSKPPEEEMFS